MSTNLVRPHGLDRRSCPLLGTLTCQRTDDHDAGHVYHSAWVADRHDLDD